MKLSELILKRASEIKKENGEARQRFNAFIEEIWPALEGKVQNHHSWKTTEVAGEPALALTYKERRPEGHNYLALSIGEDGKYNVWVPIGIRALHPEFGRRELSWSLEDLDKIAELIARWLAQ